MLLDEIGVYGRGQRASIKSAADIEGRRRRGSAAGGEAVTGGKRRARALAAREA